MRVVFLPAWTLDTSRFHQKKNVKSGKPQRDDTHTHTTPLALLKKWKKWKLRDQRNLEEETLLSFILFLTKCKKCLTFYIPVEPDAPEEQRHAAARGRSKHIKAT